MISKYDEVKGIAIVCFVIKFDLVASFPQLISTWQAGKWLVCGWNHLVHQMAKFMRCGNVISVTRQMLGQSTQVWMFAK